MSKFDSFIVSFVSLVAPTATLIYLISLLTAPNPYPPSHIKLYGWTPQCVPPVEVWSEKDDRTSRLIYETCSDRRMQ